MEMKNATEEVRDASPDDPCCSVSGNHMKPIGEPIKEKDKE